VRRNQDERYSGRHIAVELHNPDFVRLAETFGYAALRVGTPTELGRAIDDGTRLRQPLLIEVPVGKMPSPWPILHGGKKLVS
jgi:acetolactate synthase-1/2/3 large subunit